MYRLLAWHQHLIEQNGFEVFHRGQRFECFGPQNRPFPSGENKAGQRLRRDGGIDRAVGLGLAQAGPLRSQNAPLP